MKKRCIISLLLAILLLLASCESQGATGADAEHKEASGNTDQTPVQTVALQDETQSALPSGAVPSGQISQTPAGQDPVEPSDYVLPANYTVRAAEWTDIEWEQYTSPYFTLTIPKGWEVKWQGNAEKLFWNATKPGANLGVSNQDHLYAYKDYRMVQAYGGMYLSQGTIEELFSTVYANTTEYFTVMNSCVPSNYALLQSVRPNDPIHDYKALYAIFSENGVEGEGVYSAVMATSRDVWMNGMNYGVWEADCVCTSWAPRGTYVNWYPVFHKIMQSFAYTSYYIQEWRSVLGTNITPDTSSASNDSIVEAFEERSTADTILQEKRSDMIGEYERVVDNTTGEIYRAYNGFLDDIGTDQKRYTAISDSQYADGYVGWIDKP